MNQHPRVSGRHVVIGLLLFGIVMVGAMALYWELYTRPFRPLQVAIAAKFPESSPRVIGGRHKSGREGAPSTLRIVIQVPFDPVENEDRARQVAARLADVIREHHDIRAYEVLEIHLEHRIPEHESQTWSVSKPMDEWYPDESAGS